MADRKGKARAWSAKRASDLYVSARPISGPDRSIAERHLAKAYLDGIKAAQGACFFDTGKALVGKFHDEESARLGMSPQAKRKGAAKCIGFHCAQGGECPACDGPQAKRKGKSGEGRTNAG